MNERQTGSGLSSEERKRIQRTVGDALRGNDPIPPPDMLVEMFGPPQDLLEAGTTAAKSMLEIHNEPAQPNWITRFTESIRGLGDRLADDTGSLRITKRGAAVLLALGLSVGVAAVATNELGAKTYTTNIEISGGGGTDAAVDRGMAEITEQNDLDLTISQFGRVEDAKSQAGHIIGPDGTHGGEQAELVVTDRPIPFTDTVSVRPLESDEIGKQKAENNTEKYPPALPLDTDSTTIPSPNTH
jgi:hypothetical protein